MTTEPNGDTLSGIVFILDRPQDPVNVGAVVRLLGNFGLSRLRLVEPAAFDPERILTVARRGAAVLAATERHPSLESALADCAFVLGTTRRERALDRPVLSPRQAAPVLLAAALAGQAGAAVNPQRRAAVLFGPEDFGLPNAALDRCHAILRIPTAPHDASLNLAQAALLVAYELRMAALDGAEGEGQGFGGPASLATLSLAEPLAVGAELEALFASLEAMLWALNPTNIEGRVNTTVSRLRALLLRAVPRQEEALLLIRLFDHLAHRESARRG